MTMTTRVLISGASVGGPAAAYWLARSGFDVTVVEKAEAVRGGGYPIDLRGVAVEVVARMGLLDAVRARHIATRRVTAVNRSGRRIASIPAPAEFGPSGPTADLELPRGELTALLFEASRDHAEYVFGDSIAALQQDGAAVQVTFESGRQGAYDLVVGADGVHSNTRRLAFGPEEAYHRYLGHSFIGFSVPNTYGLDREVVLANSPGALAALYAAGSRPDLHVLLAFRTRLPERAELADRSYQRRAARAAFARGGSWTDRLLDALDEAEDLYVDTVSQIVMPTWHRGHVALIGDAAAAPSFLSGEGTSLAIVGAYVLAAELGASDPGSAMLGYERRLRDYVRRNQALASTSRRFLIPATRAELVLRDCGLRLGPLLIRSGLLDRALRTAANAVELPDPPARWSQQAGRRIE
ncbi:FAD-dependent monooxygenase [Microlunatus ginsengisoli]|uniref:FAD-dependent monooxygenase n=2 Tax=Microlunatus ginsengisoli TaxID=363863 RepID=A0ABP6ZZZ8_9ACTN